MHRRIVCGIDIHHSGSPCHHGLSIFAIDVLSGHCVVVSFGSNPLPALVGPESCKHGRCDSHGYSDTHADTDRDAFRDFSSSLDVLPDPVAEVDGLCVELPLIVAVAVEVLEAVETVLEIDDETAADVLETAPRTFALC